MSGLERLIDANVRCGKCGAVGVGTCSCWVECSCGWLYERGKSCWSPKHRKPKQRKRQPEGQK
jgi:hypothetical protein